MRVNIFAEIVKQKITKNLEAKGVDIEELLRSHDKKNDGTSLKY